MIFNLVKHFSCMHLLFLAYFDSITIHLILQCINFFSCNVCMFQKFGSVPIHSCSNLLIVDISCEYSPTRLIWYYESPIYSNTFLDIYHLIVKRSRRPINDLDKKFGLNFNKSWNALSHLIKRILICMVVSKLRMSYIRMPMNLIILMSNIITLSWNLIKVNTNDTQIGVVHNNRP